MRTSQEGLFDRPVASPYFASMAKQARLCPRCGRRTRLAGTLSPDAAYEVCDGCGLVSTLVAPEWARVGGGGPEAGRGPRLTVIEGGRP